MSDQITPDVEQWFEEKQRADSKIREAITEGIDHAEGFYITGKEPAVEPAAVTPLERYGIEAIIDYTVDYFRQHDETNLDDVVGLARFLSETVARDELLRKLLGAWMLEYTVADDGLPDGVLGRAVDKAVDQLMPYARRHRLWWKNVMEPAEG